MNNFEKIRNENRLLYEYVRGSTLYGLNTKDSDIDTGGVFISRMEDVLSIQGAPTQVSDSKHDNTWYELGEFSRLILKSNPTMLESLFVPENKIIGTVHPIFQLYLDNKEQFISKQCFNPFFGYAVSQIEKARGLNKKIHLEEEGKLLEEKTPYDFMYTFLNQGSTKVKDWLNNHGLKQEYCGLTNIPNMHDMYGLYYDWVRHILDHNFIESGLWRGDEAFTNTITKYFHREIRFIMTLIENGTWKVLGYRGILNEAETTQEVRLSSIDNKDDIPLINISYNQSGYSSYCKKYKEFIEWRKERNPKRYESNLNKSYDSKNMMHCFRLIHMAKEIAEGQSLNLERTWDKEFLMNVRNHKYEYEELINLLEKEKEEMNNAMAKSTIRENVDVDLVNELLIESRMKMLK